MFLLLIYESKGKDDEDESEFDADLGVVDEGPFGGILGMKAVTDADEAEAGDEGEGGGMGYAGGDLGAAGEEADQDSGHTGEME